jgi:nitrogen fixation/metabolism regulation signal transduction histidine kinase
MTDRALMATLFLLAIASLVAFGFILRQLSFVSVSLTAQDEVEQQLRQSLADQKKLSALDRNSSPLYRQRFDSIVKLLGHLRVVQFNRREVARQVEQMLFAAVGLIVVSGAALYFVERRNRERRLVRLEEVVEALSRGEGAIVIDDGRRDVIGRMAAAIERSSRSAADDRRRLRYLDHLSAWQEAARRHAHEMRTPLTAARMDVERFAGAVQKELPQMSGEIESAREGIFRELENLREFTRRFTSFATIARPRMRPLELQQFVDEFCSTFGSAWPNLKLQRLSNHIVNVMADGEMLRQVLVNLASNSSLALASGEGLMTFSISTSGGMARLDVADNGPGIAAEVRGRLFEPYTTTRSIGEGMGLGLAISKKIMLDHGGDLDLVDSARGAMFRLTLPEAGSAA